MGSSLLVDDVVDGGGAVMVGFGAAVVRGKVVGLGLAGEVVCVWIGCGRGHVVLVALAGGVEVSGRLLTGGHRNVAGEGESSSFLASSNLISLVEDVSVFAMIWVVSNGSSFVSISTEGVRSQSGDSCSMMGRERQWCGR